MEGNSDYLLTEEGQLEGVKHFAVFSAVDCYFASRQKLFKYQKSHLSGCPKLNIAPYVKL